VSALTDLAVPGLMAAAALYGLLRGTDVFDALVHGAGEGLRVTARILPSLVVLLSGVAMLRSSGALEALTGLLEPAFRLLGLPAETAPLVLLRPISGGGALAVGAELIETYGPDSLVGRIAAVMLGSTETTFYVVAVYLGAAGAGSTRRVIPAALCADAVGFLTAAWACRWLWG